MNQPLQVTAGGVHWQIAAGCRDLLLGPDGLRLDEWLRAGRAEIVKNGPHRTVYRISLPGLNVHIKHYRLMDLRAWLRELVRPAKALREYRRALAIAARLVPTVEPLAVGRRQTRTAAGDSFLITRSLDGTEALNVFLQTTFSWLPADEQTRVRQQLAVNFGRFVARLHRAGIVHNDFHAGNVLLARRDDGALDLYLIDLHATRLSARLSWKQRRANLVLLNRYFSIRAGRTDRLRFWCAYASEWRHQRVTARLRLAARALERQTWESNLRFWAQRERRCLGNNRYYQKIRSAVAAGHAVRDLDRDIRDRLLNDPDAPFRRPGIKTLKDSPSSTVIEWEIPINGVSQRVIYKRFRTTSWTDPLAALLRPGPALRSWINGHGLRDRDLPTPRPLLVLHRRRYGLPGDGYLLMENVHDAVNLHGSVAGLDNLPATERREKLRRCIDRVADLIRELHRRHLSQRDLKASNLLVQDRPGEENAFELSFVDLVGVRRYRVLPQRRRMQDLARLHVSFFHNSRLTRTDKLRFLRTYAQWGLFGKNDWKRWWHKIAEMTQAKIAKNRRNGRPLG